MSRKAWDLHFLAEPEEVAALRRVLRVHLALWGLDELIDVAQLCVSELVSNVITHVGPGTPTTLAVSMRGTRLRIEVHDPDARTLPTLVSAGVNSETGRGMNLVTFTSDRWGVQLLADRKVTWCEFSTGLTSPNGHTPMPGVTRAEALLGFYSAAEQPGEGNHGRLGVALAEEAVIDVIADLLHWLRVHGRDADDALDRAQMHFEAQVGVVDGST
ncbi:ATP-binding protein [Streptomyces europaeiscabiei]|uniref:ATP-binding protein n=1 Tax=Streptomyces europaeiscabiei TaxID=146819 RepID=UPI0029AF2F65|nr:ATP-binding protein [Streptomyces europaeiscabiei]MDX3711256.1 ATP-binding protein [Streptomyces europaeiscabiei]MDX3840096.1 ATP-binding protein [Streptomyces europaeiscabiei]